MLDSRGKYPTLLPFWLHFFKTLGRSKDNWVSQNRKGRISMRDKTTLGRSAEWVANIEVFDI